MNMDNFPYDIWKLHRKLFHRYVKYQKYFAQATKALPGYKKVLVVTEPRPAPAASASATTSSDHHVICLLSDSDGSVSTDDASGEVDSLFNSDDGCDT